MKIVVFLMRHNRKDKRNKHLAYTQTFADIFVPILLLVILVMLSSDIDLLVSAKSKSEQYLRAFLYFVLPLGILFHIFYSPKKIIKNYRKYSYSKHYIWYLRAIYRSLSYLYTMGNFTTTNLEFKVQDNFKKELSL